MVEDVRAPQHEATRQMCSMGKQKHKTVLPGPAGGMSLQVIRSLLGSFLGDRYQIWGNQGFWRPDIAPGQSLTSLTSLLPPPRVFFRRHYPLITLRFCGMDPEERK
jgi:hypothetical protein